MIGKIVIFTILSLSSLGLGYLVGYQKIVPISELVDVKAIQSVRPGWVIAQKYFCIGDCRNYSSSSSSRGGSSYGGGK